MSRLPIFAGNWKMHYGPTETKRFFTSFLSASSPSQGRSIAFFPPAVSLAAAREAVAGREDISLGVQNIYWEEKGAFTGETSAPLAVDAGASLVLVGHSERRHVFGETDEETRRKVRAALAAGLAPMLCVGEQLDERESGRAAAVVERQLRAVFEDLSEAEAEKVLIAYEPVWAIGTGRTASPADAREMHAAVRAYLRTRYGATRADGTPVLYGGSVKPDNAPHLIAEEGVDGLLVGGASLEPEGFARICASTA
jgi:triosephosphate isomerase